MLYHRPEHQQPDSRRFDTSLFEVFYVFLHCRTLHV
jgi:hypothetical protein